MKRPSIIRSTLFFMRDAWLLVMDARYNPLRYIPDPSLQTTVSSGVSWFMLQLSFLFLLQMQCLSMQREVEHIGCNSGRKREICGSGGRIERRKYELNGTSIKRHKKRG